MDLKVDIATEVEKPAIRALDLSMFDRQDLVNMILQRSEILYDLPRSGRVIRDWNNGDDTAIFAQVDRLGDEIAYRTAAVIHEEYQDLAPLLKRLAPKSIVDIGCGYAFFDLFLARDSGAKMLLIDLESNERRHFGFKKEGAAYSSLEKAKEMLLANKIPKKNVRTLNPEKEDPVQSGQADLVASFLSCGFHYPVSLYGTYFTECVSDGGHVIVDLREATASKQRKDLEGFGLVMEEHLNSADKVERLLLKKVES